MTIKKALITILFFLILPGCERKDIIKAYTFTDMSKARYFFYKIQREDSIVDINVKGYMDGSLGFLGKGLCFDSTEFKARKRPIKLDSLSNRFYTIYTDSLKVKEVEEGTQAGLILALEFIPGTAKKGKIEVVFREHGYGF